MDNPKRFNSNSGKSTKSVSSLLAHYLDDKFTIPGTNIRFGIDPLIGLIPGYGDWLGAMISIYFMIVAVSKGAGFAVVGRMFINILLDLTIGAIPIIGELFDIGWKANQRNANLLESLDEQPGRTAKSSKALLWALLIGMIVVLMGTLIAIIWAMNELLELIF